MKLSKEMKTNLLLGLFIASLIASNLIGGKVSEITIFSIPIIFSVGLVPFALTFPITDIIADVHGKKKAQEDIYTSVFMTYMR